jgi:formylglycine-generating enzyme required for sulfatase activity
MENRRGNVYFALSALLVVCAGGVACTGPETWGAAGSSFHDCAECPEMVVISRGSFVMGSPVSEAGRFDDEGPQHTVTVARPFAASRTPIGQTAEHPVVCVSWNDARAYAQWLSERTTRTYRLLSEAEYEYIARAGSTTAFAWGASDQDMCAHANGFDASARTAHPDWPAAACDDAHVHTAPVRAFPANAFGIYGGSGNVFQWTEDCFVEGGYAGAPADGSARTVEGCELRVIRGGSWLNSSRGLRAAMRDRDRQGDRYTNVGFRVAREP